MALDDDIRILSGVALFDGFTPEQLRLLAFGAEGQRIAAGRDLYREGAPADCAYVLVSGEIELHREREGERVSIASVGPGALLGELALIADTSRLTGATASSDVEVIRVNRKLFRRILEEYPDIAAMLHRRIAADLNAMMDRIASLAPRIGG